MNQPIANPNPEAARASYGTHHFDREFDRCIHCDCRPWGRIAQWPCGADVPREDVEGGLDYMAVGAAMHGAIKEAVA